MENLTSNNLTDTQKLNHLYIKEKFQRIVIQDLFMNSQQLIANYEKLIKQLRTSIVLDPEFKHLNNNIIKLFYYEISSRKRSIKLIRNKCKAFNKTYNKKVYPDTYK